jgi:hypothetical protein
MTIALVLGGVARWNGPVLNDAFIYDNHCIPYGVYWPGGQRLHNRTKLKITFCLGLWSLWTSGQLWRQ